MDTGKVIALTKRMIKKELSDLGPYHYVGTVADVDELPLSGNIGDVYNVGNTLDGGNYAWNGTAWDKLYDSSDTNAIKNIEGYFNIQGSIPASDHLSLEMYELNDTRKSSAGGDKRFLWDTSDNYYHRFVFGRTQTVNPVTIYAGCITDKLYTLPSIDDIYSFSVETDKPEDSIHTPNPNFYYLTVNNVEPGSTDSLFWVTVSLWKQAPCMYLNLFYTDNTVTTKYIDMSSLTNLLN